MLNDNIENHLRWAYYISYNNLLVYLNLDYKWSWTNAALEPTIYEWFITSLHRAYFTIILT